MPRSLPPFAAAMGGAILVAVLLASTAVAQNEPPVCYDLEKMPNQVARRVTPVKPFEIMDGVYYVGNSAVSCHLLTSEDGLILIDSTFPHTVSMLIDSIRQLGFAPSDVKLVIATHAAIDHSGGAWYFQKVFGSKVWIQEADATAAANALCVGGKKVDLSEVRASEAYPPFQADRLIKEKETIDWGGRQFTFRRTPLATEGTMAIEWPLHSSDGKTVKAGLIGGIANRVGDAQLTVQRLKEMRDIEVWLAVHPNQNKTFEKANRLDAGKLANPFVDPSGWNQFVDRIVGMMSSERPTRRRDNTDMRQRQRPMNPSRSPANASNGRVPNKNIDKLDRAWLDPDTTAPAPTLYKTFRSQTIRQDVSYLIYLPPDYQQQSSQRYPVIYWLHGTGGKQSRGADLANLLDEQIRAGKMPPMIMVLVNGLRGTTLYCDSADGKWPLESVIVNDLISHIDTSYRTQAHRDARAIEGFSMGGFGAAHLGFSYPETFGVISILDPAFLTGLDPNAAPHPTWQGQIDFSLGGDAERYQANNPFVLLGKNADKLRGRTTIRLVPRAKGNTQGFLAKCDELHAMLDQHKIAHTYDPRRDVAIHNPNVLYEALGEQGFAFFKSAFQLTPPAGKQTARSEVAWRKLPDGSFGYETEYAGKNGTPIAAYLRKPAGDGPFPLVVMLHGGGSSTTGTMSLGRSQQSPTANFIEQGWAVYSIDFRRRSEFQPIEWDDAIAAVENAKQFSFIDPTRIAMIGGSHGGHNTLRIAARHDLSCAIACAPPAINLEEVAKAKTAGYQLSPALERVLAGGNPTPGPTIFEEASKLRCPLLLVSGRNDWSSPPNVIEAYVKVLQKAKREVEVYMPENGPHGFYFGSPRIAETDEAARRAVAFISKHFEMPLKPSNSPPLPAAPDRVNNSLRLPPAEQVNRVFLRLDLNKDGTVDRQEAGNQPGRRLIATFDRNGDGSVTRSEIQEAFASSKPSSR